MSESTPTPPSPVKAPNLFERAKEEIDAIMHGERSPALDHSRRETHGMRDDIDETTPLEDVKAPNVFERAKEEIEALIQRIDTKNKKESPRPKKMGGEITGHGTKKTNSGSVTESEVKTPKFIEKVKETIGKMMHLEMKPSNHHQHHKETHGMSDDIDEVKGPSVFERAKEEFEAVFQAIHPKKDS